MEPIETQIASYDLLHRLSGAIEVRCREDSPIFKRLSLVAEEVEKLQKFNGQAHGPLKTFGLPADELVRRETVLADNELVITELIGKISQIKDGLRKVSAA